MEDAKTRELKIARIGNSRGIRLPKLTLERYGLTDTVIMEEHPDAIILRPLATNKLSWEETFAEMAKEKEDWSDFDRLTSEGIDD